MGAWAYCQQSGCDHGLDKPTLSEFVNEWDQWTCPEGHVNEPSYNLTIGDYIIELQERVEALETDRVAGEFFEAFFIAMVT